jgi:CheY-like chemotaxis protein
VPPRPLLGRRVLLLEANERHREAAMYALQRAGAAVVPVSTIATALDAIRTSQVRGDHIHVAIIDTLGPEASTEDLPDLIRAQAWPAPICVVQSGPLHVLSAMGPQGFDGVVFKPMRQRDVVEVLTRCLSTTVRVPLPATVTAAAPRVAPTRSIRALVVEDNPVNAEISKEYLLDLGCVVSVAEHGADAVSMFAAGTFDVVFMDCQMPVMDGLTATTIIRATERERGRARVPIIALTASPYEEQRIACLNAGMNAMVGKPFRQSEIADVLKTWLQPSVALARAV